MAYKKGDLIVFTGDERLDAEGEVYPPYHDARSELEQDLVCPPAIMLPHSCDSWIIGGAEEASALISDLTEAIARIRALPGLVVLAAALLGAGCAAKAKPKTDGYVTPCGDVCRPNDGKVCPPCWVGIQGGTR